jgi:hypothetical protein
MLILFHPLITNQLFGLLQTIHHAHLRLELGLDPPVHGDPAEAPVQTGFVQDDRVLDVVARIGHHRHAGVVSSGQFVVVGQFDCFRFYQWGLGGTGEIGSKKGDFWRGIYNSENYISEICKLADIILLFQYKVNNNNKISSDHKHIL